ncbi:MAG: peptide ABC transporter substrate-binding protein [Pseudomonadales bacterium]|nr:peptide ABC transporter substrate-binding protein [Pseudomonadales bacterium]
MTTPSLKILLPILITITVTWLHGCGQHENNVITGNREGILHWGNGTDPQELDPHIVTGIPEHHIITALLEGLVLKNPETLEPIPGVAERWRISDDGKIYTFFLRDNARWSNGDPVTAEDFAWSWWRALQPKLGNQYAYMYFPIKNAEPYLKQEITDFNQVGIKVLDKLTLQVELNHPTPYFLQLLDHYSMFPVHRATLEKFGNPAQRGSLWTRPGNYVGNGPFQLKDWKINKLVSVERNPYYWDANSVQLNQIHFHPTENITTEERMFRAGQLHHTASIPIDKVAVYQKEKPHLLHAKPYLGNYYYRFNTKQPHLRDKRVRRALAMAIDREQIVAHVTKGSELPADTFTPPDTLGYSAKPGFEFNPEKARRLMADAGYPDGKGFPATELLYNTSEGHRKIAVAIQQMWNKYLGINITLNNQDWKVYLDSVENGDYTIARAGWIGDYVDPNTFLDMWVTGGGNNLTGWSNPRYDELILKLAPRAKTRDERYRLMQEAEALLLDDMPIIPLYIYTSKSLVHPSVKGLSANILDYTLYKNLWLDANAAGGEAHP